MKRATTFRSMNKPTKEELKALLQTWKLSCEKDCERECNVEFKEGECEPCFDAIRRLIENMHRKVNRKFVEGWRAYRGRRVKESIEDTDKKGKP